MTLFVTPVCMVIGYARFSTDDQANVAQLSQLKKAGCKRIFEEKISGRNVDRHELARCLGRLDEGGTLVVWRLDRLGRSLADLLEIVSSLQQRSGYADMARPASRGREEHRVTVQGGDEGRYVVEGLRRGPNLPRRQVCWIYQLRSCAWARSVSTVQICKS